MEKDVRMALRLLRRTVYDALPDEPETYANLTAIAEGTGIPREICRALLRHLVECGSARRRGPLAGSGWTRRDPSQPD